jgi:membrane-associated phospholipid phosphatase
MDACPRDCFPSGHTEIPLLTLWLARRYRRKLFLVYLPITAAMIFSTVYLRFHYVVDVLAGAALAGGIILAVKLLEARAGKRAPRGRQKSGI